MEILLCYVFIYLVEALILWLYCNDLFIPKYTVRRTALSLFILYCIQFFLSLLNIYTLNAIACFAANIIFLYFFYDTKWSSALFHAGITVIAMTFGELLSFSLFPNFARNFYEMRSNTALLAICSFLSKLIYFLIIYILSHLPIALKNKKATRRQGALLLIPIPLVTFFIMITLYITCMTTDISPSLNIMISVCSVLLLLLNLLIWFFFSYTQKRNQDFMDLQVSLLRENDTAEYYKMLSTQNENRNILIHDIRGHLYAIAALAEQNQQTEITDYINELIQTSSVHATAQNPTPPDTQPPPL